jgi:hypothetical protein
MDHPHVRGSLSCPICLGSKARGLVACSSCNEKYAIQDGNLACEVIIEVAEQEARQKILKRLHLACFGDL